MDSTNKSKWQRLILLLRNLLRILCPVSCVIILLLQSAVMDYYLVVYNNYVWCLWALADVAVAGIFLASLIIAYRLGYQLTGDVHVFHKKISDKQMLCELTLCTSWLLYSVIISTKIGLLYGVDRDVIQMLKPDILMNGNVLRTALCASSIIFFTLTAAHRDALIVIHQHDGELSAAQHEQQQKQLLGDADLFDDRSDLLKSLSSSVAFDLLDSVQFLDVLYIYESHVILSFDLHSCVVAFTCINFILPTMLLLTLLIRNDVWLRRIPYLRHVVYIFIVNTPMFVIRCIIWHFHQKEVSVFIVKNLLEIGKAIYDMVDIHARNSKKDGDSKRTNDTEMTAMTSRTAVAGEQN